MKKFIVVFMAVLAMLPPTAFAGGKTVALPAPRTEGGKPLMECLKERHSQRSFSAAALPDQVLSDLLWAAFGINRPDGHRTAPSAMDKQEMDIYVAREDGLYRYNAAGNSLELVREGDIRPFAGVQGFVKTAPVNLIYVADQSKMGVLNFAKETFASLDVGFIAQNVYLFCASEGLATVVRGSFDAARLSKEMKLRRDQKIMLAQTVGYPAE